MNGKTKKTLEFSEIPRPTHSNLIRLENPQHFRSALSLFSSHSQISIFISRKTLKIISPSRPFILLALPPACFSALTDSEFTVHTQDLLSALSTLETDTLFIGESLRLFKGLSPLPPAVASALSDSSDFSSGFSKPGCDGEGRDGEGREGSGLCQALSDSATLKTLEDISSEFFIDIPLSASIHTDYLWIESFSTRLLINPRILKNLPQERVTYTNENGRLVVTSAGSGCEDKVEVDVDYIMEGFLDFRCRNRWVGSLVGISESLAAVSLGFSEGMLVVKGVFEWCKQAYFEIRIEEYAGVE